MGVTQHPDPDNTLSLDGSRAKIHFDVKCVPARVAGAYQATSPRGRGGGDFAYHIPAPESEDLPGQNYGIISPYTGGIQRNYFCLLYTSPSPRDVEESRMPSSA